MNGEGDESVHSSPESPTVCRLSGQAACSSDPISCIGKEKSLGIPKAEITIAMICVCECDTNREVMCACGEGEGAIVAS